MLEQGLMKIKNPEKQTRPQVILALDINILSKLVLLKVNHLNTPVECFFSVDVTLIRFLCGHKNQFSTPDEMCQDAY